MRPEKAMYGQFTLNAETSHFSAFWYVMFDWWKKTPWLPSQLVTLFLSTQETCRSESGSSDACAPILSYC